jgi:bifunctional enzyme CysN/CysC
MLVNKMDLVDYSEEAYQKIADDFRAFAAKLDIPDLTIIPVSALKGDNVVTRSENMPWYEGSSLLHHLENIHIGSDLNLIDVRFPVQYVIRPQSDAYHDYRGYAGTVAGGTIKVGDEVMVQPSGLTSRVVGIDLYGQELQEAHPPMSVSIRLADDLDISRGDMLCRAHNHPHATQDLDAMIVWMQQGTRIQEGNRYIIKHTTRTAKTIVKDLQYRLDINDLHRDEKTTSLGLNEIGRVTLRITQPLFVDEYRRNRLTGSFILIDEASGATVAAGMVVDTDI